MNVNMENKIRRIDEEVLLKIILNLYYYLKDFFVLELSFSMV